MILYTITLTSALAHYLCTCISLYSLPADTYPSPVFLLISGFTYFTNVTSFFMARHVFARSIAICMPSYIPPIYTPIYMTVSHPNLQACVGLGTRGCKGLVIIFIACQQRLHNISSMPYNGHSFGILFVNEYHYIG